jgi:hypothetical protein
VLVDMATGAAAPYKIPTGGPFRDRNAFTSVPLPPDAVLIEHVRFCGRDHGIRFHVNPGATHELAQAASITRTSTLPAIAAGKSVS